MSEEKLNQKDFPIAETRPSKVKGKRGMALSELTMDAVGYYGMVHEDKNETISRSNTDQIGPDYALNSASNYLNLRKTTIYGGSNEIQKNILSKMVLGL